jgi:hypothetical protein
MKRLCQSLCICLLLWGCAAPQPQREIIETFQSFLSDIKAGNREKILLEAPFLASLSVRQRAAAVKPFQRLAAQDSGRLHMEVRRGSAETYLLRVSVSGEAAALVVPFHRNEQGLWEMSPVLEAVQHIDIVPAR